MLLYYHAGERVCGSQYIITMEVGTEFENKSGIVFKKTLYTKHTMSLVYTVGQCYARLPWEGGLNGTHYMVN